MEAREASTVRASAAAGEVPSASASFASSGTSGGCDRSATSVKTASTFRVSVFSEAGFRNLVPYHDGSRGINRCPSSQSTPRPDMLSACLRECVHLARGSLNHFGLVLESESCNQSEDGSHHKVPMTNLMI